MLERTARGSVRVGETEKQGLIIIHSKDRGGGRKAAQALEQCNRFAPSHEDTHSAVCVEVCGGLVECLLHSLHGRSVTDHCNVQSAAFRGASSVCCAQVWVSHSDNIQ